MPDIKNAFIMREGEVCSLPAFPFNNPSFNMEDRESIRSTIDTGSIVVRETVSPKYHDRTVMNAREADLTVAFAVDFSTAGEKLTREAAGDRYLAISLPATPEACRDADCIRDAALLLARRTEGQGPVSLNIAGNGLDTLMKAGVSQEDADHFIAGVLGVAMSMGMSLAQVLSGGQSGIDESGVKAAVSYSQKVRVTCPRGYLFRDGRGFPHWNRDSFLARFNDIPYRKVPEIGTDVRELMNPHERSDQSRDYRPSQDSPMLGAVAGDILGAPYRKVDLSGEGFEFFAPTRTYSRDGVKNHHPRPTDNSCLAVAVSSWLMDDGEHSQENLRRRISEVTDPHLVSSNAVAVASSVTGLYATGPLEAVELSRTVIRAFGRNPETEKGAEAAAYAVFLASHGRNRHEIDFAMEMDYGIDVSVARAGIHAAELMSQGVKGNVLSNVLLQEHGVRLGQESGIVDGEQVYKLEDILPHTSEMREQSVLVNGEPIKWMEPTGRADTHSMHSLPLALACLQDSFTWEETVRKAIRVGGDSPAVASLAGALSAAYFGGVPAGIADRCRTLMGNELYEPMMRFAERGSIREEVQKEQRTPFIDVHYFYGSPTAVIRKGDKDLLKAAAEAGINVVTGKELSRMMDQAREGERTTRLDGHYEGMRRLYLTDKGLVRVTDADIQGLPSLEQRKRASLLFNDLSHWCREVRLTLESNCGINDPRNQARGGAYLFQSAYYPRVMKDRIEIREGDLLAGAVSIDQNTGLLRIQFSGDYRDGEYREADWCRERVFEPSRIVTLRSADLPGNWRQELGREGVSFSREELQSLGRLQRNSSSYTEDIDGIKESIARFVLDAGVGVDDTDRVLNYDRANRDVAELCANMSKVISNMDQSPEVSMRRSQGDDMFNALSAFNEGYRVVRKDGLYNLEDRKGGLLLHKWYPEVTPFAEGFARVRMADGLWNYVDHEGVALLHNGVQKAQAFSEGLAAVCKDGRWNYIRKDGYTIGRRWFEDAGPFVDGKATVQYEGRQTRIDREGRLQNEKKNNRGLGI